MKRWQEVPRVSIKGGIVGLAKRHAGACHRRSTANLASEEKDEVVDDKEDRNRDQGCHCCLGKSSGEGEKKKRKIAVDKRKMATSGGGEEEKNVRNLKEKKESREEKERTNKERKEDVERFLETSWGRFRRDLRSSWRPIVKESYQWRR